MRRNLPTRVTRGSFGILKSGGGRMLRCWREAFSSSALRTIVRNLNIGKRTPCWPVRCCANRTGPGDSSRMASAHSSPMGSRTGSATRQIADVDRPFRPRVPACRPGLAVRTVRHRAARSSACFVSSASSAATGSSSAIAAARMGVGTSLSEAPCTAEIRAPLVRPSSGNVASRTSPGSELRRDGAEPRDEGVRRGARRLGQQHVDAAVVDPRPVDEAEVFVQSA